MHDDVIINPHTNDIYYKDQFIPLDTPYKAAGIHIGSVTSIAAFDFIAFPTVPCHITQVQGWKQDLRTGGAHTTLDAKSKSLVYLILCT